MLVRRYRYVAEPDRVRAALVEYSGTPGRFAAVVRRVPASTPESGSLLATATLRPQSAPDAPRPQTDPAVVPRRAKGRVPVETRRPNRPEERPAAGAEVSLRGESLRYWRLALEAVCRVAPFRSQCPEHARLYVEVGEGRLRLFGRDHWRCALIDVPADTTGRAAVGIPRDGVLPSVWGRSGLVALYERRVAFVPAHVNSDVIEVPLEPVAFPSLPDDDAAAGVLVDRLALLRLLEALPEPVVHLRRQGAELSVGAAVLPVSYATGPLDALVDRRFLVDAARSGDAAELTIEALGGDGPLRIEAGSVLTLVSTRSEFSLL